MPRSVRCLPFALVLIYVGSLPAFLRGQAINYDFDGNTLSHFTYTSSGDGVLDATDNAYHTYMTSGTTVAEDSVMLLYGQTLSFTQDWSIDFSFSAPTGMSGVSELSNPEEINVGFDVRKTGASDEALMNLELAVTNDDGGANERNFEWEYNDGFGGGSSTTATVASALTTITFSLTYDYTSGTGTGMLTAFYGNTQIGSSFDLLDGTSGWNVNTGSDTASVFLYAASADIDNFDSPYPTFSNFTVSAVPEPAHFATWFAIVALGLVGTRRRP